MKKVVLIFSFIFSFLIIGFTQSNSTIDVVIGGEFSYNTFDVIDLGNEEVGTTIRFNDFSNGIYNYRIGLNISQELINKVYLKTGIRFAKAGYRIQSSVGIFPINSLAPIADVYINLKKNYLFFEFPIIGRYEFSKSKFALFVEMGLSPHIYLTTKEIYYDSDRINYTNNNSPDFNSFHLVGIISIGLNAHINKRFTLFVQPIFRNHFTSSIQGSTDLLRNYGLELGLRKNLGIKKSSIE